MKKMLVFFVVLCMLFSLAACMQPADQTGDSKNSVTPTGVNDTQNFTQQENLVTTNSVPEETEGQQNAETVLQGTPLYINTVGLLGQAESQLPMLLDYETYGLLEGYIATQGKEVYTETFFRDHSVILIGLEEGVSTKFCLTGITYTDGVATCSFDLPWVRYVASLPASGFQYCMITLDTVLPLETEIKVELNSLEVDEETYQQMAKQYWDNVI